VSSWAPQLLRGFADNYGLEGVVHTLLLRAWHPQNASSNLSASHRSRRMPPLLSMSTSTSSTPIKLTKAVMSRKYSFLTHALLWHLTSAVRDSQIQDQIKVMNQDYNSTGISFNLVNISRIESEDMFLRVAPDSCAFLFIWIMEIS